MTAPAKPPAQLRDFSRPPGAVRHQDVVDGGPTLAEVGRALGVSRERVRQLETSALRKVADALRARGFGPDDFLD